MDRRAFIFAARAAGARGRGHSMIDRRRFLGTLTLACLFPVSQLSVAQPVTKVWRIAFLHAGSAVENGDELDALRKSLSELGYVDGKNVRIEAWWAEGHMDDLPQMAIALVRSKPDIILARGGRAPLAVQQATKVIPIVGVASTDPSSNKNVASMARPGGNFTGTTNMVADEVPKWVELAHEVVPRATRVGILMSNNPTHPARLNTAQIAARTLHVALVPVQANDQGELEGAFAELAREAPEVVIVLADSMFFYHSKTIIALAARYRLPTVYTNRKFSDEGGLISFGASNADYYQRTAHYVDKILKGANPGDLPIEQPTKFDMVINLKTAKALGITVPQSLLLRADEVIQ
jgi:putative ABC transport system substrate-binding protein